MKNEDAILQKLREAFLQGIQGAQETLFASIEALRAEIEAGKLTKAAKQKLSGELLLIESVAAYPNLEGMIAKLEQAQPLLAGQSRVVQPDDHTVFGMPSVLLSLSYQPGTLEQTCETVQRYIALYSALTGAGAGTDIVMRAELCLDRGQIAQAEVLAYKAACVAEEAKQDGVEMSVACVLMQLAIYKGNAEEIRRVKVYIQRILDSSEKNYEKNKLAAEIIECQIYTWMRAPEKAPDWVIEFHAPQNIDHRLKPVIECMAQVMSFLSGRKGEMLGRALAILEISHQSDRHIAEQYNLLAVAIAYSELGMMREAQLYLRKLLVLTEQDQTYLMASRFWRFLLPVITPESVAGHEETYREIKAHSDCFAASINTLRDVFLPDQVVKTLTEKERQVAHLAADGYTNKEIAKELGITMETMKSHLRTIFQKLSIERRNQLAKHLG